MNKNRKSEGMRKRLGKEILWLERQKELLIRTLETKKQQVKKQENALTQQNYIIYRLLERLGGETCIVSPHLEENVNDRLSVKLEYSPGGELLGMYLKIN